MGASDTQGSQLFASTDGSSGGAAFQFFGDNHATLKGDAYLDAGAGAGSDYGELHLRMNAGATDAIKITWDGSVPNINIGMTVTQKVGFFGVTPVIRQANIADAAGTLAQATTAINAILDNLQAYGLMAGPPA